MTSTQSPRPRYQRFVGASCLAITLAACGGESDSGSSSGSDAATEDAIATSSAAQQGFDTISKAAGDALLEQNGGEIAALMGQPVLHSVGGRSVPGLTPATTGNHFDFASSVSVIVDLDAVDAQGKDRYPNASGSFLLEADSNGSLVDGGTSGSVTYVVDITIVEPVTVVDPYHHFTSTVTGAGSDGWTVAIDWSYTDDQNWSYHLGVDRSLVDQQADVITGDGRSFSVSVDASHDFDHSGTMSAGTLSFETTWAGVREALWTGTDGRTHEVRWDVSSLDHITLTVDGVTYGPYTLGQLWFAWHVSAGLA